MRRGTSILAIGCTVFALAGCGGPGASRPAQDGTMSADAFAGGSIPAPGTSDAVDCNFGSVEPNDTPAEATPLGTAKGSVYTWVTGNTIGGTDSADYFVFESSSTGGTFTLGGSGLCWGGALTSLSATLWKVNQGRKVSPPVDTWTQAASDGGRSNCLMGSAMLEPSTEYLLGVFGTGGAGQYAA